METLQVQEHKQPRAVKPQCTPSLEALLDGGFRDPVARLHSLQRELTLPTLDLNLIWYTKSKMVSVASDFIVVIRSDGVVHAWGANDYGQLNVPDDLGPVKQISAGDGFVLAVREDGTVRGWGRNDKNQLAIPTGLTDVVCVSAGSGFAYALRSDGSLACWGTNSAGALLIPEDVQQKGVKAVSCAGNKIAFVASDTSVTTMN
jgi:alpha-tubulin suppressor-like RCC1 family protein